MSEPTRLQLGDQVTREQIREFLTRRKPIEVNGPMAGVVERIEELEDRWVIYTRLADEGEQDG